MQRTYSPRGFGSALRVFVGLGLSIVGAALLTGGVVAWIMASPSADVRLFAIILLMLVGLSFVCAGGLIAMLKRSVTIDATQGIVSRQMRAGLRLYRNTEQLSEFGAVTLCAGGIGTPTSIGEARFSDRAERLHVCLVRGAREDAARIACSMPEDAFRWMHSCSKSDGPATAADLKRFADLFVQVTTVIDDVERARQEAAGLARLTELPFGHPTLGPDAKDPAMQKIDLPPKLCLDPELHTSGT